MKTIPLTKSQHAIVDDADYESVARFSWHALFSPDTGTFYAARHASGGGYVYLHRQLLDVGGAMVVDHIDGNPLNNQRSNLRCCTRQQNQCNSRIRSHNTSGFKGVSYSAERRKFAARIRVHGKTHFLGRFDTALEAAHAYDRGSRLLHGEFGRPNFPE